MFDIIIDRNKRYKADDLFQWDTHVRLDIYGLSLAHAPEIHFSKSGMTEAIVKQSEMTRDGIISVEVPDIVLQTASALNVYICGYDGEEFRSWYSLVLKVQGRIKPADYIAEDDEKIYSYNALENLVNNTVVELTRANEDLHATINAENTALHNQIIDEVNHIVDTKLQETVANVNEDLDHAVGLALGAKASTTTFNDDGSILVSYTDGTSEKTTFNADGSITVEYDWGEKGKKRTVTTFADNGDIVTTFETIE